MSKCISASINGLIFESTNFHPFGGGQASSVGTISFPSKQNEPFLGDIEVDSGIGFDFEIPIIDVGYSSLNPEQIVHKFDPLVFESIEMVPEAFVGQTAKLSINKSQRILDSRCHSAGHLLDIALFKISPNFSLSLSPSKGSHIPPNLYVEYKGVIPVNQRSQVMDALNNQLKVYQTDSKYYPDSLIQQKTVTSVNDISKLCQNECPTVFSENGKFFGKPCRVLLYNGYGCPCSGTHVEYFGQVSAVNVTKIQKKGKNTRISYNVDIGKDWLSSQVSILPVEDHDFEQIMRLEYACFPPDEVDTTEMVEYKIKEANGYFLCARAYGRVLGFITGTRFQGENYTKEKMKIHEPTGNHLGIHGVAVDPVFEKRGIATAMVTEFVEMVKKGNQKSSNIGDNHNPIEKISLISHDHLVPYYCRFGFINTGISDVVLGSLPWYTLTMKL